MPRFAHACDIACENKPLTLGQEMAKKVPRIEW